MKARKKSVVVEFIEYDGFNSDEVKKFAGESLIIRPGLEYQNWETLGLKTSGGIMNVSGGDYIIKDVKGEFYPCDPDDFHKTYDIIEENRIEKSIKMRKLYGVTENGDLVTIIPQSVIKIEKDWEVGRSLWNDMIMTLEGNIEQYAVADSVGDKFERMLSNVVDADIQALKRIKLILDYSKNK